VSPLFLAVLIILVALSFDFINGFHDAANSVAIEHSTSTFFIAVAFLWLKQPEGCSTPLTFPLQDS
jgi:phosphate/sulfate permease